MTVATEVLAVKVFNVVAGTPVPVNYPLYSPQEVVVYYGKDALTAALNVDYTITLADAPNFFTFTLVPTASLLAKINALIASDPTEVNYITIRRELALTTTSTPSSVANTVFTSREFDRTNMKLQQLDERLKRSVVFSPGYVGAFQIYLPPPDPGRALVWDTDSTNLVNGPNAQDIADAAPNAAAAEASALAAAQAAAAAIAAASVFGNAFLAYENKALAQAATIPATSKSLLLIGYYAGQQGLGMGSYKRVTAAPAVALAGFRSTDRFMPDGSTNAGSGGWWALLPDEKGFITPEQCGAPASWGGPGTADTTYIQAAITHSQGKVNFRDGRHYYLDAELTCPFYAPILRASGANLSCWLHVLGNYGKTLTIGSPTQAAGSARIEGLRFWRDTTNHWMLTGKAIAGMINASSIMLVTGHGLANGDYITIKGSGVPQADNQRYRVKGAATNAFQLGDEFTNATIDMTGWTPWVSGGNVHPLQTGSSDASIGIDNAITYGESWHIRFYGATYPVIKDCSFTGHGRQLWFDAVSYPLIDHCDMAGWWDEERALWQETEANIWFSSAFDYGLTINGITNASPARMTVVGHKLKAGDRIYVAGNTGQPLLNNRYFTVQNVVSNSFDLYDYPSGTAINTIGSGTSTSDGLMREVNIGSNLQTVPMITNCILGGTGQPSMPGFSMKSLPYTAIVGNASVPNSRADIGAKYGVAVRNAEGLIFTGNYTGGHNRASLDIQSDWFAVGAHLTGHVLYADNFQDPDNGANIHVRPGEGAVFALTVSRNRINGADIGDHFVKIETTPTTNFTVAHFVCEGNTGQGHRRTPVLIDGVKMGLFVNNTFAGYNAAGNTDGDATTCCAFYAGPNTFGFYAGGNVMGGAVGNPAGANSCKWGTFFAGAANTSNGNKTGSQLAYNLGLAGGSVSTLTATL